MGRFAFGVVVLLAFALAPRVEAQRPAAGFAAGDAAAAPRERVGAEAATPAPVDPRPSVGFFFATDYLAGVGPSGGDLSRGVSGERPRVCGLGLRRSLRFAAPRRVR